MKKISCFLFLVSCVILLFACGSGTSTSTSSTTTTSGALSTTVPADVVISSPTAESSSAGTSLSKGLVLKTTTSASSYIDKRSEIAALVAGTGSCSVTMESLENIGSPSCYGPQVTFSNHPDGIAGQFGGGDLGIWSEFSSGTEACSAAQMNNVVKFVASRVDNIVKVLGALACAGEKGSLTLPAVNSSVDLSSYISSYVSISGLTISSATLQRLADDGSNPVYKFTLTMTISLGGTDYPTTVILKHIPTTSDNSTYKGKMSFKMAFAAGTSNNCPAGAESGKVMAGTVLYEKSSSSSVTYEVKYMESCGVSTNPFNSDNNISFADKASASNLDGWADNGQYGLFNMNPSDGSGTVAYGWQAGMNDGWARTLNVTTTVASDGSATGRAYFGYGPDLTSATASTIGGITGMICNWNYPTSKTVQQLVQYQPLTKSSTATTFTSDTANLKIKYAPTNSCNSSGGDFTYQSSSGTMTNDNSSGATLTNELLDINSMSFTKPTAPSDVGS